MTSEISAISCSADFVIDPQDVDQDRPRFVLCKPLRVGDAFSGSLLAAGLNGLLLKTVLRGLMAAGMVLFCLIAFNVLDRSAALSWFPAAAVFYSAIGMLVFVRLYSALRRMSARKIGLFAPMTTVFAEAAFWRIGDHIITRSEWSYFDRVRSNRKTLVLRPHGTSVFYVVGRSQLDDPEDWLELVEFVREKIRQAAGGPQP